MLCLAFARLRVTVDRRGLRVTSGLFRVPPGRSAILVTGGPGIVVEHTNGSLFAVTVADLLTALAAR